MSSVLVMSVGDIQGHMARWVQGLMSQIAQHRGPARALLLLAPCKVTHPKAQSSGRRHSRGIRSFNEMALERSHRSG